MTFEQAIAFVLEEEGGLVRDPQDPGGTTNFGISQKSYPQLDIAGLTREQACEIYRQDFWERLKIEMMPDAIRLPFLDFAVNQGSGIATITLQRLVGTKPDGVIGYLTLAAATNMDPGKLRRELLLHRMKLYVSASGWPRFGAGWAARLLKVALYA